MKNEASFRFNTSDLLVEKGKLMAAEFLLMARPNLPTQPINVTLFISQTMPKQSNMLVSLGLEKSCTIILVLLCHLMSEKQYTTGSTSTKVLESCL